MNASLGGGGGLVMGNVSLKVVMIVTSRFVIRDLLLSHRIPHLAMGWAKIFVVHLGEYHSRITVHEMPRNAAINLHVILEAVAICFAFFIIAPLVGCTCKIPRRDVSVLNSRIVHVRTYASGYICLKQQNCPCSHIQLHSRPSGFLLHEFHSFFSLSRSFHSLPIMLRTRGWDGRLRFLQWCRHVWYLHTTYGPCNFGVFSKPSYAYFESETEYTYL